MKDAHSQNPASGPAYPQPQPAQSRENNGRQGVGWSPAPLLRQASGGTQADGKFCLCSIGLFYLEVNPCLAIPPLKFSCGLLKLGLLPWQNRPLISSLYSILVYDHPAGGLKGALPSINVDIYEEISLVDTKGLTRIGWHHRISWHDGILWPLLLTWFNINPSMDK